MLPTSHALPINPGGVVSSPNPAMLADAFSEFISASALLEASYRDLQREVRHLNTELAERNAALSRSLNENDRMRAALQQIIDSMPCGVLVLDAEDRIRMLNPEGRGLLELGRVEVHTLCELSAMSGIDFELLAAEAGSHRDSEICLPLAAGKRWLAIGRRQLSLGPDAADGTSGRGVNRRLQSIWIFRDVTDQKQAEETREAARHAVALAQTSAILAHEIRNPLASMELFAGLIADEPEQVHQWLSHLRAGIRQLSGTVNNVLSLQPGAQPFRSRIELTPCVRGAVEFARPLAEQAGVGLSFESQCDLLAIAGNENAIRQIVLNLVGNAIRHTQDGGEVRVKVRGEATENSSRAVVMVADNGCGIPQVQMERIFDVGYSGKGDTPGLGLAVCRRLMTQLEGEITVTSQEGAGTTFRLEFAGL